MSMRIAVLWVLAVGLAQDGLDIALAQGLAAPAQTAQAPASTSAAADDAEWRHSVLAWRERREREVEVVLRPETLGEGGREPAGRQRRNGQQDQRPGHGDPALLSLHGFERRGPEEGDRKSVV